MQSSDSQIQKVSASFANWTDLKHMIRFPLKLLDLPRWVIIVLTLLTILLVSAACWLIGKNAREKRYMFGLIGYETEVRSALHDDPALQYIYLSSSLSAYFDADDPFIKAVGEVETSEDFIRLVDCLSHPPAPSSEGLSEWPRLKKMSEEMNESFYENEYRVAVDVMIVETGESKQLTLLVRPTRPAAAKAE